MPMFSPKKPLSLHNEGENYGNPGKYSAFAREVLETQFTMGGVWCHVYRYQGVFDQQRDELNVMHDEEGSTRETTGMDVFLGVQDPILGENRDRAYDFIEIPRLKGIYQISQSEFELLRFGFRSNETLSMEFHIGQIERELGRRFVMGDVIELPHLREVGLDGRVANKWYEVKDMTWSPGGYDPTYQRHVVGVILQPLRDQQEFLDLFENVKDEYGKNLHEQASNKDAMLSMSEAIQGKAGEHASTTWWDTTIMWFDPDHPSRKPEAFIDDARPDNALPVKQGTEFPGDAADGDWFLRLDLEPNRLYRFEGGRWKLREIDRKREWQPYNWTAHLRAFMSDRSREDRERPYELRSIHDVITDREHRSDPSGEKE